jgi:hypothetical protein
LAKASTLALISMLVIIITVITQGVRVPADMKGKLGGSLVANNGFFQAVGVISFGEHFETLTADSANISQRSFVVGDFHLAVNHLS